MASQDELADLEWEGHVADKVWEVNLTRGNGKMLLLKILSTLN